MAREEDGEEEEWDEEGYISLFWLALAPCQRLSERAGSDINTKLNGEDLRVVV